MAMWLPTHLIDRMRCGLWRSIRRQRPRRLFVTVRESEKFEENRTLLGQLLDGGEKEFRIRSELFGSFNSRDWKVFVIVQQIAESRISWNSKFSNMCIRDLDKFYLNWWFYLFYLGQFTPLLTRYFQPSISSNISLISIFSPIVLLLYLSSPNCRKIKMKICIYLAKRSLDPWLGPLGKTLKRRPEFCRSLWRLQVWPAHKWNPRWRENKLCSTFQWSDNYLIKFTCHRNIVTGKRQIVEKQEPKKSQRGKIQKIVDS